MQEREGRFVNLAVFASIDGTNNFRDNYTPALGFVVSRSFAPVGTLFLQPIWVNNSNPLPSELADDNDSVHDGGRDPYPRAGRQFIWWARSFPALAGDTPGVNQAAFALEKRAGGHMFQLNFSNTLGTTMGQIARGGARNDDWYLGFNISRKFF